MALTVNVNYFNSFYLKRIYADGTASSTSKGIPYVTEINSDGSESFQGARAKGANGWSTPIVSSVSNDWYVEESRIGGGLVLQKK